MPRPFELPCVFDDDEHVYRDHHGRAHRSVTQILSAAGTIDFSMVDPIVLAEAARRGTHVHRYSARWDELRTYAPLAHFLEDVPTALHGYLIQYEMFLLTTGFRAVHAETERPRLVDVFGTIVGMTPDRVGYFPQSQRLVVLDLKTGTDLISHPLQLAGYSLGFERALALAISHERVALYLQPDRYKISHFHNRLDYHAFLDAMRGGGQYLEHWKAQRKLIA